MRLLVESVKDYAIFMLDPAGRITSWNSGAQHIKGYLAQEVIGAHFSLFYPPAAIAARHPEHELEVALRDGRYEEEGWRVRKNGQRFWANVVITAIRDPADGALRGFAKVTRDLTERRHMQEQALRERLRAEEAARALEQRDEFIAVAAHELRTPLAALVLKVQGVTRALHTAGPDDSAAPVSTLVARLEGALRQLERLTALVERLLGVAHLVQGKLVLEREATSLSAVVERVVEGFREPALRAGSELQVRVAGEGAGTWDVGQLEQVIASLLANAIKFGRGRPIEVLVETTLGGARLCVTDHGVGIAPEDLGRIFARFERAASVRHYGGLGLGLYLARSIVEAHGGSIHVASTAAEGTTFMIELPQEHTLDQEPSR